MIVLSVLRGLERARAEQEIDDVPFVRLEPIELNRRHWSEIQPVDMDGVHQLLAEFGFVRNRRADEYFLPLG